MVRRNNVGQFYLFKAIEVNDCDGDFGRVPKGPKRGVGQVADLTDAGCLYWKAG